MPSSGHTDYLGLPQWLVTDHPHMPDEINAPFAALDAYAAGRRLQTYTALDQIGLSGLVTTAQVCAALPTFSKLVLRQVLTDATRITDVPYDWVMVTITRPGLASNCKCVAGSLDGADQWTGIYNSDNLAGFSGWGVETIQSGSNEKGQWIKYPSGAMICAKFHTTTVDAEYNKTYYAPGWSFPREFSSVPVVILCSGGAYGGDLYVSHSTNNTTSTGSINLANPTISVTINSTVLQCEMIAIGRWKE